MCNSAHEITHVDDLFCGRYPCRQEFSLQIRLGQYLRIDRSKTHSLVDLWVLLALFIPAGIAQLVQRLTERCKIDAGLSPPVRKGTFSQSLTVTVQPPCAIACIKSVGTLKIPKTGTHFPLFGYTKTLHTLIAMGSAALAAALLYPRKVTRISRKEK